MRNALLNELLETKGRDIITVSGDESVFSAVKKMVDAKVGSLLIVDDQHRLLGIISDRDVISKLVLLGLDVKQAKVSEVMTQNPITVAPDCTVNEVRQIITNKRVRHLPVVENDRVVGMISIGDVTKYTMEQQQQHIDELTDYINK
ncbi:MAG: CBS domain-containing protein [Pseudomonadota bacterium]